MPTGATATTFLRGDGTWVTPTDNNTTYTLTSTAPTVTTGGTVTLTPGTGTAVTVRTADADSIVGNEVTNTADASLVRTGSGTNASPYVLSRGALTGDVTAAQGNNTVTVTKINGSPLGTTTGAPAGQVLAYNGTNWVPAADTSTTAWYVGAPVDSIAALTATNATRLNRNNLISHNTDIYVGANSVGIDATSSSAIRGVRVGHGAGGVMNNVVVGGGTALRANVLTNPSSVGNANTAIGYNALAADSFGMTNTAVGAWAMEQAKLPSSLASASIGNNYGDNTAVGVGALRYTSGRSNTAIGVSALSFFQSANTTSGNRNTIIGAYSGQGITSGNDNIVIGVNVLNKRNSTGSHNIIISTLNDSVNVGGSDTIRNANLPNKISINHQLNIGNVIFGNGIDSATGPNKNARIGIGVDAPQSALDVDGSITNSKAFAAGSSGTIGFNQGNLAYISANSLTPAAIIPTGMKDGGTYRLLVMNTVPTNVTFSGTNPAGSNFTFHGSTTTVPTVPGQWTLFTFVVMGLDVAVWTTPIAP